MAGPTLRIERAEKIIKEYPITEKQLKLILKLWDYVSKKGSLNYPTVVAKALNLIEQHPEIRSEEILEKINNEHKQIKVKKPTKKEYQHYYPTAKLLIRFEELFEKDLLGIEQYTMIRNNITITSNVASKLTQLDDKELIEKVQYFFLFSPNFCMTRDQFDQLCKEQGLRKGRHPEHDELVVTALNFYRNMGFEFVAKEVQVTSYFKPDASAVKNGESSSTEVKRTIRDYEEGFKKGQYDNNLLHYDTAFILSPDLEVIEKALVDSRLNTAMGLLYLENGQGIPKIMRDATFNNPTPENRMKAIDNTVRKCMSEISSEERARIRQQKM